MSRQPLRPASGRDWTLVALGAVIAVIVIAVAFPRYSVISTHSGLTFIRLDHWTGEIAQCSNVCRPVKDGPSVTY